MRDTPCSSGCRPRRNPLRCEPSCKGRSGSRESWVDRQGQESARPLRTQKTHKSSRALAGKRAEAGLQARSGRLSTDARQWILLGAETTRTCSSRSDRHLRQETSREAWTGAYPPTFPGGLLLTPSSIGNPPGLNRMQNTSLCAPLRIRADTNESQKQSQNVG